MSAADAMGRADARIATDAIRRADAPHAADPVSGADVPNAPDGASGADGPHPRDAVTCADAASGAAATRPADMVVFGEDWGAHPSSTQHLVARLAAERRILYVNSVGLRRPRLSDAGRLAVKARALLGRPATGGRDAAPATAPRPEAVMTAPAVPLPGAPAARLANRLLWRRTVGARARGMGLDRPILWVSLPTALDARAAIPHRALVYYCGDEFGALEGVDHAAVLALEAELAAAADLVLVSHPRIAAKFDPARTVLLPHGVDVARFAAAEAPPPGPHPVAGFLGRLDERLDYGAIARAAEALPGWRFRLAGPAAPSARADLAALAALPNVELPGPVAPDLAPGVMKGWTVALLPYRDTPMTRACDPLKLREYLAAGLPVAAFPIEGVRAFGDVVQLSAPDRLAGAVLCAAAEPAGRAAARRARVAGDDWATRAAALSRLLARLS